MELICLFVSSSYFIFVCCMFLFSSRILCHRIELVSSGIEYSAYFYFRNDLKNIYIRLACKIIFEIKKNFLFMSRQKYVIVIIVLDRYLFGYLIFLLDFF